MSYVESNMLPLGTIAPDFTLLDTTDDQLKSLHDLKGDVATVVIFMCNHCPYVVHVMPLLVQLPKQFYDAGIKFIGISSNDVENYPDDSPDKMKALSTREGIIFPYLYDETQEVAKTYDAACTPDTYVFDKDLRLVYRGQLDQSRPGNNMPVTGKDLLEVLNSILENKEINPIQRPGGGCNIKWKK